MKILAVLAGGAIGAVLRYLLTVYLGKWKCPDGFPWVIASINICGSFILGLLMEAVFHSLSLLFLVTGLLGAFTTFSTFSVEAVMLYRERKKKQLAGYLLLSLLGSLLAFTFGYHLTG